MRKNTVLNNINALTSICRQKEFYDKEFDEALREAYKAIETLEVGYWVNVDATHSQCSQCHAIFEISSPKGEYEGNSNYCPNCGAKMEI